MGVETRARDKSVCVSCVCVVCMYIMYVCVSVYVCMYVSCVSATEAEAGIFPLTNEVSLPVVVVKRTDAAHVRTFGEVVVRAVYSKKGG